MGRRPATLSGTPQARITSRPAYRLFTQARAALSVNSSGPDTTSR